MEVKESKEVKAEGLFFDDNFEDINFPDYEETQSNEKQTKKYDLNKDSMEQKQGKYDLLKASSEYESVITDLNEGYMNVIDEKPREKERIKFNPEGLFPGFSKHTSETQFLKLNNEDYDSFNNLEFNKIAKVSTAVTAEARLNIASQLLARNIDVSTQITDDDSEDLKLLYLGLFSEPQIFHAIVLNSLIENDDWQHVAYVLLFRDKETLQSIKDSFFEIYKVQLEEKLETQFGNLTELLKLLLGDNFQIHIQEMELKIESERIFNNMSQMSELSILENLLDYHPVIYKELMTKFYINYGYTLMDIMKLKGYSKEFLEFADLINGAMMAPDYFYCKMIHEFMVSNDTSFFFPYMLLTLDFNGLEYVINKYKTLYSRVTIKNVANRYGTKVGPFVYFILSKYFEDV